MTTNTMYSVIPNMDTKADQDDQATTYSTVATDLRTFFIHQDQTTELWYVTLGHHDDAWPCPVPSLTWSDAFDMGQALLEEFA